jgi:hypothetical protein
MQRHGRCCEGVERPVTAVVHVQIVTMSFLGQTGEVPLAAASLSMVACNTMGTLFIMVTLLSIVSVAFFPITSKQLSLFWILEAALDWHIA